MSDDKINYVKVKEFEWVGLNQVNILVETFDEEKGTNVLLRGIVEVEKETEVE